MNNDTTEDDDDDDDESVVRHLTLKAHGEQWSQRLQRLVDEGYLDDLIV